MTDQQWQYIVHAIGASDAAGAYFGLTPEQTEAHRQAFREAAELGGDAFLAALERDVQAVNQRSEPLSMAEVLRLQARQAVALVIEEYFTVEALAALQGTRH